MPFVFKFSAILLVLAVVAGQFWQQQAAAAGSNTYAAEIRKGCPAMGGPEKIETLGQKVRFYDAYLIRVIGGRIGLNGGCAAR